MRIFCFAAILAITQTAFALDYSFQENFEGATHSVVPWVKSSTAKYTVNFFGQTVERAVEGQKCLKLDVTLYGDTINPSNYVYYYWQLPLLPPPNLLDSIRMSARIWCDSTSLKWVSLASILSFPPTKIGGNLMELPRSPEDSIWYFTSINACSSAALNGNGTAAKNVYGATHLDFGADLGGMGILIRGTGPQHIVLYLDDIRIGGRMLSATDYTTEKSVRWSQYKVRLDSIVQAKHAQHDSLGALPDTLGHALSATARNRYAQLRSADSIMNRLLFQMDSLVSATNGYFGKSKIDSLDECMIHWSVQIKALQSEINTTAKLNLYTFPATRYWRLTGTNLPNFSETLNKIAVKACRGEYEPATFLVEARQSHQRVHCIWTGFTGPAGTISSSALDVRIAKPWYQAGHEHTGKSQKTLVSELLVKNDSLVVIDTVAKANYLRMQNQAGGIFYANISTPTSVFPDTALVYDADSLLPFPLDPIGNKQFWLTFHIPATAATGMYTGAIQLIGEPIETLATIPLEIEVLPFVLDSSRLTYSLYYHGTLTSSTPKPFNAFQKTPEQLRIELADMREHGVLFPTCYQTISQLDAHLAIRNEIGFPKDRLYSLGIFTDASPTAITNFKAAIQARGYSDLYVYGIDEAHGPALAAQRAAWQAVHAAGANVFVAGYTDLLDSMKELIDVGNVAGVLRPNLADAYHALNNHIFSYANPQVGVENPEIYRRNYGLALWKAGYDGCMDYAYQKNYGAFWNDFDPSASGDNFYREETFTYPTSNGILPTIQWEGFREGIDDVRYLSTLLNRIDRKKAEGADVSAFEQWVSAIDPAGDLDNLRRAVIGKILEIDGTGGLRFDGTRAAQDLFLARLDSGGKLLRLSFRIPKHAEKVDVRLYDLHGREIASWSIENASLGPRSFTCEINSRPSAGVYVVNLALDGKANFVKTMAIVK